MTDIAAVVHTSGLSKSFDGVDAVRDLDLEVRPNSIYGFLGPNGAGKTTTMKMLLGLLFPTAGRAEIFGMDIVRDSTEIRARVGYLPQDPRFYEHMTARETLRFTAGFFYSGPGPAIERRVSEMLELVGLSEKADRAVKGFSGGERQRLGIAQAQVNDPDLLILDEPAASLDPLGRRDVLAILERLRERATVIYSTHILDDVQRVSDTVGIIDRGRLVSSGPIGSLLAAGSGTAFEALMRAGVDDAVARLSGVPWVADVTRHPAAAGPSGAELSAGAELLVVAVTDEAMAERELLRLLLAEDSAVVVGFRKRSAALEDVFLEIVEGGDRGE